MASSRRAARGNQTRHEGSRRWRRGSPAPPAVRAVFALDSPAQKGYSQAPPNMSSYRSALRNPWWIPPFLGGVPEVDPRLIRLLGLVSLALFFEQYDNSMLTAALKYIAQDLGMGEKDLGGFLAIIKLGAVPAFLIIPFADRLGRRKLFLLSVALFSVGTCLTAVTQSIAQFVVVQSITHTFMVTASAVAVVVVTEEYPALFRGWAIGMVGALAACGNGLGAGLFAAIDSLPYGWRSLYVIGLVPLLLLPMLRRGVQETGRFHRHRDQTDGSREGAFEGWYRPLLALARTHPRRALALALVGCLFAIGEASVFQFVGYFTLTVHHWTPGEFSLMFILGGAVGIIGNIISGRLGDRIGRRTIGFVFLSLFPVFAWLFYNGPGWILPIAWALFVFCNTAAGVVVRAFSTELFPTSHRGTSAGWLFLVQTFGWAIGLALVGLGTREGVDIARMTSLISLSVAVAAFALLLLPETYRQELEALSHETGATALPPELL
jgi:MFS family permease